MIDEQARPKGLGLLYFFHSPRPVESAEIAH